jgi:glycogenin glucosyltransferase
VAAEKAPEKAAAATTTTPIEEPSYKGPSAAWEKDEAILTQETPAAPSEEEKDVLET